MTMTVARASYAHMRINRLQAKVEQLKSHVDTAGTTSAKDEIRKQIRSSLTAITRWKKELGACTYPDCKCIVSTTTSQPAPVCKLGLPEVVPADLNCTLCRGTGVVRKYIGHSGRVAAFICSCTRR